MIDIAQYDKTYTESTFKSKVDNMFVMLHTAIMLEDLDRVRHFISDDIYNKYNQKLIQLKSQNVRQMYDELNVKSTVVLNSKIDNDKIVIEVLIVSRYMDYLLSKKSGKCISGNNKSRIEKNNYLTLEKRIDAEIMGISRKCPACNANINVNENGKCEYCGTIFNTKDFDWIITDIQGGNDENS